MSQQSKYLNTREEVAQVFCLLRDHQSEIKLRFLNEALTYTARVLDLDADHVLLQNIIPNDGIRLLNQGVEFSISGRADGLFIYIAGNKAAQPNPARATGADDQDRNGFFKITLPTQVLYQQRRKADRKRPPLEQSMHRPHVQLGAVKPLYGRILEVSRNGVSVEIDPAREDSLSPQQRIDQSRIHVPNQLSVTVDLLVRHTRYNEREQTMTSGLELLHAEPEALAELNNFVDRITL